MHAAGSMMWRVARCCSSRKWYRCFAIALNKDTLNINAAHACRRFYDVEGGQVLLGGHDLKGLQLASLRRAMAIVPQVNTVVQTPFSIVVNELWG